MSRGARLASVAETPPPAAPATDSVAETARVPTGAPWVSTGGLLQAPPAHAARTGASPGTETVTSPSRAQVPDIR